MSSQRQSTWRRRVLQVALATPGLVIALVFSLVFSAAPALAATTHISTDPFTQATCAASNTTNHHTEVEPDSFSNGSTIVAAFQVGRIFDGGACAAGFATSTDNGATWTSGLLPGITKWTASQGVANGPNDRATDEAVAWDAAHGVWLISSLTLLEAGGVHGNSVVTSRSSDGIHWSTPFTTATGQQLDKNWIVCDNTSTSPFFGHCYTEWDDNGNGNRLQMSTSTDGGQHWSAPATNNSGVIGGQPVVRPDGTVIVPIDNANETAVGAFHSTDGGATWSAITTITTIRHHTAGGSLREGPLPSAEVDGAGTVYVVWADSRFRSGGSVNDIVITHSTNATGTTWSTVARVPIDATNSGRNHMIPGLAVNKATSGSSAQLGLTYYFTLSGSSALNVGFISSTNGGSTWSAAQTVTSSSFPTTWAATTSQGRMVGDYISTSYGSDNLAHGVFVTASAPTSGTSCSSVLDNCQEPTDTFGTGLAIVGGTRSSAGDPVLAPPRPGGSNHQIWRLRDVDVDY